MGLNSPFLPSCLFHLAVAISPFLLSTLVVNKTTKLAWQGDRNDSVDSVVGDSDSRWEWLDLSLASIPGVITKSPNKKRAVARFLLMSSGQLRRLLIEDLKFGANEFAVVDIKQFGGFTNDGVF